MHSLIKEEDNPQASSQGLNNQYIDSDNNKIQWNSGHWTRQENVKCIAYFQFNKTHLHSKLKMKENKFFKQMSMFIASRNPIQCRSQCQKLLRKHKTFFNIIQAFKNEYGHQQFDELYEMHSENPLIRFKGSLEMLGQENQMEKCREISVQTERSFLLRKNMMTMTREKGSPGKQNSKEFPFLKEWWS